jgi:hypothetical protein
MNCSDKAIQGAASAPVTPAEVRRLILEAQAAWRTQCSLGLADEDFDAWRRGSLYDALRKTSFRAVGQHEFGLALAHFEKLAGREPSTRWGRANHAIAAREAGPEGDRRRAEHVLRETCAAVAPAFHGSPEQALAYALSLLRRIHRTDLPHAAAKQIWQVKFTLSNRAKAHARKLALQEVHS